MRSDVFEDIPPVCAKTNLVINEVFTNPEVVMSKLVLNIYTSKLQVRKHELCHRKMCLKVFVIVRPEEGLAGRAVPILLLARQ